METPSRASASSPDPLNELEDNASALPSISSTSRRITRSQRSSSLYSLDAHSRLQQSRFSSPRKQTFHLDVGSGTSPQKIRVTVETEGSSAQGPASQEHDVAAAGDQVKRRLFAGATPTPSLIPPASATASRRRQRSSSPSKTPAAKRARTSKATTTTKVPLRGLSDDEDAAAAPADTMATPKPKRGRPRRSGTPLPAASKTAQAQPASSVAATPSSAVSATPRRGRKPRAATPKVEQDENTGVDELASASGTTPSLPRSPVKRTPRAARRTATPGSSAKRSADSAFAGSEAESIASSRPSKRGRGRPRRQAMAPDEMAAIAEHEHEDREAHLDAQATPRATAQQLPASPDPVTVGLSAVAVSPAPTSLSSVDLINVQTPVARQSEANLSADSLEQHSDALSDDLAYGAPSPELGSYDEPDSFGGRGESPAVDATAPAPADSGHDDVQTPRLPRRTENALTEADAPIATDVAAPEQVESQDELAPILPPSSTPAAASATAHSDIVETYDDAPVYSEEVQRSTRSQVSRSYPLLSSPLAEPAAQGYDSTGTTSAVPREDAVEAGDASPAAADPVHDEVTTTIGTSNDRPASSPRSRASHDPGRQPDDRIHFSSVESPFVQGLSSVQYLHEGQIARSEMTAAGSDGDVDAVASDGELDGRGESDAGFEAGEEGVTTNLRDLDTIAKGEDFSMIGVESLQASFQQSHSAMPEMGDTTSRIVSRSLESIRHGHSTGGNQDKDGLSYLDFLFEEAGPSTPVSGAQSSQALQTPSASQAPPASQAALSDANSSPASRDEAGQQPSPARQASVSPRKREESLGRAIARKSLYEAQASRVETASPELREEAQRSIAQDYEDSFSAIPDSVLDAVVPEAVNASYFSRQQATRTSQVAIPVLRAPGTLSFSEANETEPSADHGEGHEPVASSRPGSEVTSSPPLPLAAAQRQHLATQERRTTPVAFLSPRFPPAARHAGSSDDRLRVPSEGFRPSLSPIVRAGRALQSVTSDPPTPKENEPFLRSPFRGPAARDTQSPPVPLHHDPSTPDPEPANYELVEAQLLREQSVESERAAATQSSEAQLSTPRHATAGLGISGDELADDNAAHDEPLGTAEPQPLQSPIVAPSQPSPRSATRAAWNMAMAPFSGIKNLVLGGAQGISPRLRLSARPASSSSPGAPTTPAQATTAPANHSTQTSPRKRNADEAQLNEAQASSSGQASHRAKRARVHSHVTPSRQGDVQPGSGSDTGRSWRSYIFRENSVAGSITGFAAKLVSRTPQNESPRPIVANAHENGDVTEAETDTRPTAAVLPSEGNSTQYGSDAIMDMINDISGEGRDVGAGADESGLHASYTTHADQEPEGMDVNDIPQATPAVFSRPEEALSSEGFASADDDVDIWAIEADRTTRLHANEVEASPSSAMATNASAFAPVRDMRIARVQEADPRSSRRRGFATSHLRQQALFDNFEDDLSLLSAGNEPEQASLIKNPPRPAGQFILDDFFSSPIALPRELPPTSEQNVQYNEQSRQLAMRRIVEHERRNEARQRAAAGARLSAASTTPAVAQQPRPSYAVPSDSESSETSAVDDAAEVESSPLRGNPTRTPTPTPPREASASTDEEPTANRARPRPAVLSSAMSTPSSRREPREPKKVSFQELGPAAKDTVIEEEDALESLPTHPVVRTPRRTPRGLSRAAEIRNRALASFRDRTPSAASSSSDGAAKTSPLEQTVPRQPTTAAAAEQRAEPATAESESRIATLPITSSPPGDQDATRSSDASQASDNEPFSPADATTSKGNGPLGEAPKPRSSLGQIRFSQLTAQRASSTPLLLPPKRVVSHSHRIPPRPRPMPVVPTASGQLRDEGSSQQDANLFFGGELSAQANSRYADDLVSEEELLAEASSSRANVFFEDELRDQARPAEQAPGQTSEQTLEQPLELSLEQTLEQAPEQGWHAPAPYGEQDEESSFLTPLLKPLPPRSASPTKSCLRPATKPKTPGRVVEFTSSTMAPAGEEILAERAYLRSESLRFAEHFGLDTDNRVPAVRAPQPYNEDGDVRMWDRKEVANDAAAAEEGRRSGKPYEVDEALSEIMLSDTHKISDPSPSHRPLPRSVPGRPLFLPADNIVHTPWTPPLAIERPAQREWDLEDWLEMSDVLQAFRKYGPAEFRALFVPRPRRAAPHARAPAPPGPHTPDYSRPSHVLFNKVVHTDTDAMLVKNWHLDIVDAFALRAGRVWNEHYLVRRLFSLLIAETRRGIFG